MLSIRNRLLFLLVLISVIAAVPWSTALARGGKHSSATAPVVLRTERPHIGPMSGEPDVGQGPKRTGCTQAPGLEPPVQVPQGAPIEVWLQWIVRDWMVRWMGAR